MHELAFPLLIGLIGVALAFDFLNGLHDAANSIATVVSTRVLSPMQAVAWAAFFNVVAISIFQLKVAATIGKGTIATAQTGIPNSVEPGAFISGYPAIDNKDWLRSSAAFRRLPELRRRVAELAERLQNLERRTRGG